MPEEDYKQEQLAQQAAIFKQQPNKYWQQGAQGQFPTVPMDAVEDIENAPGYEKLSPFEKSVYGWLPKQMEKVVWDWVPGIGGKTIGEVLEGFSESWAGKALMFLDVGAEGIERTLGLAAQWLNDPTQQFNLADAWYAGSLTMDMSNLPGIKYDDEGNVTGLYVPTDLPGMGGLAEARRRIGELREQVMSRSDALKQVRQEYYNSLGALQLRAQLHDTFQHIFIDPLPWVMKWIKPIEWLQTTRKTALAGKILPADDMIRIGENAVEIAEDALRIAQKANKADDIAIATKQLQQASVRLMSC